MIKKRWLVNLLKDKKIKVFITESFEENKNKMKIKSKVEKIEIKIEKQLKR